jgi:hypothetical protein
MYGLGDAGDHLPGCAECRDRFAALQQRRTEFLGVEPEVPEEILAAQRRVIRAKSGAGLPGTWGRFAPVGAALLLFAAFLVDFDRHPTPGRPAATDDAQVFQEVFDLVSDPAPNAVEPIRSFFEERQ